MKRNKGISLIVLVITIIVMIILAGAIILSLNNAGIIGKANQAVDASNEAQIKNIVQVYWAEAYASGLRKKTDLETAVYSKIDASKLDVSEYGIAVTTKGVKVVKGWVQDELVVRKGKQVLNIGDNIDYDETAGGTVSVEENVTWQILGASDNGELLILSSCLSAGQLIGAAVGDFEGACKSWLGAIDTLDSRCQQFKNGRSATGARSLRIDDVDKITGYDKTTYRKGELYEYGNKITYTLNGTNTLSYTTTNGLSGETTFSNGFYYYDGENIVQADLSKTSGEITLENTGYHYSLDAWYNTDTKKNLKAKQMLTRATFLTQLWHVGNGYGICTITPYGFIGEWYGGDVLEDNFVWSILGSAQPAIGGVSAVVSLSPETNFTGSSDTIWKY